MKSPKPENKAQRKVENLLQKVSAEIITENYELEYQSCGKCEIYRDTGVSKNILIYFSTKQVKIRRKFIFVKENHNQKNLFIRK